MTEEVTGTYAKLQSGEWGVRLADPEHTGKAGGMEGVGDEATVEVVRKNGDRSKERVRYVWSGKAKGMSGEEEGVVLCEIVRQPRNTFARLDSGEWGVRVSPAGDLKVDATATVEVSRKSGDPTKEKVKVLIVDREKDVALCEIIKPPQGQPSQGQPSQGKQQQNPQAKTAPAKGGEQGTGDISDLDDLAFDEND